MCRVGCCGLVFFFSSVDNIRDMLTLREAAAELAVHPATLRQQLANGVLRGRKVGPVWTITRRDLERYRAEHLGKPGRKAKGHR